MIWIPFFATLTNIVGLSVVEYVAENPEQVDKIHNLFENSGITNGFI
jgi:hypothetical protein